MQKARDYMGIGSAGGFSKQILRLRISGPHLPHLTLVDLPGLIHNPVTEGDKEVVDELVEHYMIQDRSIILAVVPCNNDPETQAILRLAKERNPDGNRTMGIVTKADQAQEDTKNQEYYLACARGEKGSFQLGWHFVRNAGLKDRKNPDFNRDAAEREFFERPDWSQLMPEYKGIDSLRSRLSSVLFDFIKAEMPAVIREIEGKKIINEQRLNRLGNPRETPQKQRVYLIRIGEKYQRLVHDAIEGYYNDGFFASSEPNRKLRTVVRDCGNGFHQRLLGAGHTYDIFWDPSISNQDTVNVMDSFRNSPLMHLIAEKLRTTRGWEIPGSFNPLIISPIFKEMSAKWVGIAQEYAEYVWQHSKLFVEILLKECCEPDTYKKIIHQVVEKELDIRRTQLRLKIDELATPYTKGHAFTFSTRLEWLQRKLHTGLGLETSGAPWQMTISDDDPLACEQVFVRAQAFYQVAIETFIDNVTMIAVENCLISGLENVLSPGRIAEMTDDELDAIASESSENQSNRQSLQKVLEGLDVALKTCRKHQKLGVFREPTTQEAPLNPPSEQSTIENRLSEMTLTSPTTTVEPPTQDVTNQTPGNSGRRLNVLRAYSPAASYRGISPSSTRTASSSIARSTSTSTLTSPPDSSEGHKIDSQIQRPTTPTPRGPSGNKWMSAEHSRRSSKSRSDGPPQSSRFKMFPSMMWDSHGDVKQEDDSSIAGDVSGTAPSNLNAYREPRQYNAYGKTTTPESKCPLYQDSI